MNFQLSEAKQKIVLGIFALIIPGVLPVVGMILIWKGLQDLNSKKDEENE